jgi:hypothetical protein
MRLTKRVNWRADVPVLLNHYRVVDLQEVGRVVQSLAMTLEVPASPHLTHTGRIVPRRPHSFLSTLDQSFRAFCSGPPHLIPWRS